MIHSYSSQKEITVNITFAKCAAFLIHHQNMALITHGYYSVRLIFSICLDEQDHEQAEVPG